MSYVECLVLGLLHSGATYGHAIDKMLDRWNARLWTKTNRAAIYQALKRMEKKGWVVTSREKVGNMPERTTYGLTEEGLAALRTMVADGLASRELVTFDYTVPAGLLFVLPPDVVVRQLAIRIEAVRGYIDTFARSEAESAGAYIGKRANIRFLHAYYRTELEWLEWLTKELDNPAKPDFGPVSD
ncbi:PadR family transcriptional regulator [Paenibacillus flagellatus]|nr:PadR family transcriptional regulator [Paenibacillus flagellatus]